MRTWIGEPSTIRLPLLYRARVFGQYPWGTRVSVCPTCVMLAVPALQAWVTITMSKANTLQSFLARLGGGTPRVRMTDRGPVAEVTFADQQATRAINALMVLDDMVARGDIMRAEDGSEFFCFPLSALIGDILGGWRAESENDEEDGSAEPDNRNLRKAVAEPEPLPLGIVREAEPALPALVA